MTSAPIKWLEKQGVRESKTKLLLNTKCVSCPLNVVNELCPFLNTDVQSQAWPMWHLFHVLSKVLLSPFYIYYSPSDLAFLFIWRYSDFHLFLYCSRSQLKQVSGRQLMLLLWSGSKSYWGGDMGCLGRKAPISLQSNSTVCGTDAK